MGAVTFPRAYCARATRDRAVKLTACRHHRVGVRACIVSNSVRAVWITRGERCYSLRTLRSTDSLGASLVLSRQVPRRASCTSHGSRRDPRMLTLRAWRRFATLEELRTKRGRSSDASCRSRRHGSPAPAELTASRRCAHLAMNSQRVDLESQHRLTKDP
jgi:hypothetical protein